MRLLRLELTDWRRFHGGPHEITFSGRSTVLTGPNEAGKSTIFEAIKRVLFDRCQSTAKWVQHIVPYGIRGAVPMVLLEFEHNGGTWCIEKRFGRQGGSATLSKWNGKDWIPIAKNKDAEDQLRQLFGATFSSSSDGTKPENWGAFQWLFVPQDDRDLPKDRSQALGHLGLTQVGVSDEFNMVLSLVKTAYQETFTPTGQVSKKSSRYQLQKEFEQLRQEKEELEASLRDLAEKRRLYDEIQESLPSVKQAKEEWDRTINEHVDLSGAEAELRAAEAEYKQKKKEVEESSRILEERTILENDLKATDKKLKSAIEDKAVKQENLHRLNDEWKTVREKVRKLEEKISELRRLQEDATDLHKIRDKRVARKDLAEARDKCREIDNEIKKLKRQLSGKIPSAELIEQITELTAQVKAKQAAMESSSLQVAVSGHPKLEVLLDGKQLEGTRGTAIDSVVVNSPEGGSVRIEGDTSRAQRVADEVEELQKQIKDLLAEFDVDSPPALRGLFDKHQELERQLEKLETERAALDKRSLSEIEEVIETIDQEVKQLEARRTKRGIIEKNDKLSDSELVQYIECLHGDIAEMEEELDTAKAQREDLYAELEDARAEAETAETEYQIANIRKETAEKSLDQHRDQYGSTEKCRKQAKEATEALEEAEKALDKARKKVEKLNEDVENRRKTAQQKYDNLNKLLQQQKAQAESLARELETAADRGLYARAAELERRLTSEEARLARIQLRTDAIKLLKETMEGVRSSVIQTIINPIKEDLDARLATVTRGRYTLAMLSDELEPQRLQGNLETDFEDGSQGLRELVNTLLRMSVAAHLAVVEPQTLLLDDPCVHVSRERTARVVELLNQLTASGMVQAVVMTHRADEFAGLEGKFVDVSTIE